MNKLFTTLLLVASFTSWSQLNFNSPYSLFTLGDTRSPGTVYNHSMGGVGVSNGNGLYLNLVNPAMLSRNKTVTFDMGITGAFKTLESGEVQENSLGVNFDGIFLGFPISRKLSTAIGITPFSTRSYDFNTIEDIDQMSSATYNYKGTGGLSKILWSTGGEIYSSKKSRTSLSVGLEVDFIFGPMEEQVSSVVTTDGTENYYTASYYNRQTFSGFTFKPGAVFRKEFKTVQKITKGAVWSEKQKDSVNIFTSEKHLFSKSIVDQASNEMVIGKYLILFAHRTDVFVSREFVGRKTAEYFKASIEKVKPEFMGVYIRAAADLKDRATVMAEYDELLAKYEAGEFTTKEDANYERSLARHYTKRGNGVYFNLGGTYGIKSDVSGKSFFSINQTQPDGSIVTADTIVNNEKVFMTLPSYFQLGLSIDKPSPKGTKKDGRSRTSVWSLAVDFSKVNWSKYSNPADVFDYDNSFSINVGGEICPDITQKRSKKRSSKIFYRGGFSFENAPYSIEGDPVQSVGMNVGFGFPMFGAKQLPRYINLNLGYGRRGLTSSALIKESYYNFGLSISFNNKFSRRKAGL